MKWLLDEIDRDRALRLRDDARRRGAILIAPPHLLAETSSAIYKRSQQGAVTFDEALVLVEELENLSIEMMSPPGLTRLGFEIATDSRLKWVYDAFYVALAEIVGCELWTADARLHQDVQARHSNVRLLSEYPLRSTS